VKILQEGIEAPHRGIEEVSAVALLLELQIPDGLIHALHPHKQNNDQKWKVHVNLINYNCTDQDRSDCLSPRPAHPFRCSMPDMITQPPISMIHSI
jgi:hypothetical protein